MGEERETADGTAGRRTSPLVPDERRLLVVDANELTLHGLRALLGREPWVARCLTTRRLDRALELAARYRPHLTLLDVALSRGDGAVPARRLGSCTPLVLMQGAGRVSRTHVRAVGAVGWVAKDWPAVTLLDCTRQAVAGALLVPPQIASLPVILTDREGDVLRLVRDGATNAQIAERLFVSPHTVKSHTVSLYRKLNARNRAEAVGKAQRLGLLEA